MAEGKDNVVRISFGVKGGGEISGDSGARIKRELNAIVQKISPLTIDVSLKSKSLEDIKGQLQKISGDIKANIDVELSTESIGRIKEQIQALAKEVVPIKLKAETDDTVKGSGKKGAETPKTQRNAPREELKVLRDFISTAKRLGKITPREGHEYNALQKQYDGLLKKVEQVLVKSPDLKSLRDEGITGHDRNYELATARNEDREVEAKINNWIKLDRQLANVTDETSESYKKLQKAAGDAEKEAKAAVDAIEGDHPKATSKLNNAEETVAGIRSDGNDKKVTERIKEWIKLQKELSKVVTTGVGNYEELEKAVEKAAGAVESAIGESDPRYIQAKAEVNKIALEGEQKRNSKLDGNLQIRWERAVAGASSLNERYVDLIKNSKKAREAIDALYKAINKGQLTLDSDVLDPEAEGGVRKANVSDIAKQTQDLEKLYKQTSGTMSELEAKSHTLGNQIKDTFNSKLLQSFAYALVGLLTGALRKVYTNVVELDSAITDLQIATGKTREETTALVETYADLAKQLGATMTEVAEGADTWLRQGYSVEETTQLISDSMMLAKLGQLEAAEASKALTSAMKGYKVEVDDALSIVDKFTAVDMEAAVSAGDIATAMAETAASANVAGVSMDRLIGYISTVSEVTQDGAESVGNFYKTLFARMGNVKTGRFIDNETGERLNDVEGTLGTLGIQLRDSNDTFRDFGDVLDEVGARWNSFTNVQQHAIATAFAGTRQQEKFIVLMENYGQAMEYANVAAESEGTATSKYNVAYLDSIEAKVNELTAAWQGFSMTLLDSSLVKDVVEALTVIVNLLDAIAGVEEVKLIPFMVGISVAIAMVVKSFKTLKREAALTATATGDNFAKAGDNVKKAAASVTSEVSTMGAGINSEIVSMGDETASTASAVGQTVENVVATRFRKITNKIGSVMKGIGKIIITALPAIIPTILGFVSSFDNAEAKIATAVLGIATIVGVAITLITAAIKKFEMSNPIGWILAAISALIMGISAIVDLLPSYEKSKQKAEEAKAAWEETARAIEENTSKIEELRAELEELNSLENKSITDEDDISRLEREIALLEQRNQVLEDNEKNLKKEAEQTVKDTYSLLAYGDISDTELSGAKDVEKWMKKNGEDLGLNNIQDLVGYAISNWNKVDKTTGEALVPDSLRTFVTEWLMEANELTDGLEYGDDPLINGIIDSVRGLGENYYLQAQGIDAYWENLRSSGEHAAGIKAIEDFANEFKKSTDITGEAIAELEKESPAAKAVFDHLEEIGAWDGVDYNSLALFVQDLRTGLGELAKISMTNDIEVVSVKFDTLSAAIEEAKENGIVSLETLKNLMEETPNELDKYFEKIEDGYGLSANYNDKPLFEIMKEVAMGEIAEYQDALATAKENLEALSEEDDDYEMAQKNLATAQDNLNTKTLEWSTILKDLKVEDETEKLEARQEALEKELDIYKDLVDIRKDILETYQEEASYQKELNRKQVNVATLQAQLSAARLDNSAEGQARQRLLADELQTAQEELDEYTLEHAIQDITISMDNEYAEYEAFINEEVEKITNQIDGIATTVKEILGEVEGFMLLSDNASDMYSLYSQISSSGLSTANADDATAFMNAIKANDYSTAAKYYQGTTAWYNKNKPKSESEGSSGGQERPTISPSELTLIPGASAYNFTWDDANDYGKVRYSDRSYRLMNAGAVEDESMLLAAQANGFGERAVFKYKNKLYAMTDGGNHVIELKDRKGLIGDQLQYLKDKITEYAGIQFHQGGFVGDLMSLKSNEQFAKLLKGEFVSTPAQMDNFMKNILPNVMSYSNGATINNNSPLITIQCGTIDDGTLPKLSDMVDAAVAKIERNMENALTRRGYRAGV